MFTDEEIYNFLRTKYIPQLQKDVSVVAVYLRGSRYAGTYKPTSDWDFTLVVDKLTFGKKKPDKEGYPIDVCLSKKHPTKAKLLWNI